MLKIIIFVSLILLLFLAACSPSSNELVTAGVGSMSVIPVTDQNSFSRQTTCENGVCNVVLYSGTRFGYEDDKWKPVSELRSFKDTTNIKCVVIKGKGSDPDVTCLDFNETSITLDFADKDSDILVKVVDAVNESKVLSDFGKSKRDENSFKVLPGQLLKIGDASTTIQLQDPDTENLEDSYFIVSGPSTDDDVGASAALRLGGFHSHAYLKFDLTPVPDNVNITDSKLGLYLSFINPLVDDIDLFNVSTQHIFQFPIFNISGDVWIEGTESFLNGGCGGNELCGDTRATDSKEFNATHSDNILFNFSSTEDVYYFWNVSEIIEAAYSLSDNNVTIWLNTTQYNGSPSSNEWFSFISKEGTANQRPYLNITYQDAEESIAGSIATISLTGSNGFAMNSLVLRRNQS